jgi:hypothetical protein
MGLAIEVGMLAYRIENDEGVDSFRKSLDRVNKVLAENNLPSHVEPEVLTLSKNRAQLRGYSYSYLHHLRRFAAHAIADPDWKPTLCPPGENPARDPVVIDESSMLSSHLLCHSDCEGFYVPIDFDDPLFADKSLIPGCMLGSSQALMRELIEVAPALGITLDGGQLSDAEADRINSVVEASGPFEIELAVWLSLFEAARLSIQHGTAICFV